MPLSAIFQLYRDGQFYWSETSLAHIKPCFMQTRNDYKSNFYVNFIFKITETPITNIILGLNITKEKSVKKYII